MSKKSLLFIVAAILLVGALMLGILHRGVKSNKTAAEVNLYQKQADTICKMLNNAHTLYKAGHVKKAYDLAENAYWNVYDNVLEIKYRSYATPAYIFAVEGKFHKVSALMSKPVTNKKNSEISQRIKALCTEVNTEASYLIKHN